MADAAAAHPDLVTGTAFVYRRQPAVAAIRELVRRRARRGVALQRPLLVRLRPQRADPDGLALQGRPGHRRAGRHRQPPDRPRRVRLRADDPGRGRRLHHQGQGALPRGQAPPTATPAPSSPTSRSRSRTTTWPPSPPTSPPARSAPSPSPGSPPATPTRWPSTSSPRPGPPSGTWTARPSSRSSASCATTASTATTRCSSARRTPTSRAACRWTSPASRSASATCSASSCARSSSRSPASRAACPPVATFADGVRDLTIIDAVIRSAAAGGAVVDLPPHHSA